MEVSVTKRTRDGGRDIIARGELIPGEPSMLAVEVKQKAVVGIEDVQRALKANEDYPALLLATAGRFQCRGAPREAAGAKSITPLPERWELRYPVDSCILLREGVEEKRMTVEGAEPRRSSGRQTAPPLIGRSIWRPVA